MHMEDPTLQDCQKIVQVVAVNGSNVVQPQLFKKGRARAGNHAPGVLVNLGGGLLEGLWKLLSHALDCFSQFTQGPTGLQPSKSIC